MYSEKTVLDIVTLIYDAAADPSLWPVFLERYQALTSARKVALGYEPPGEERVVIMASGADQGDIRKYHQYPCPWLDRLLLANWRTGGADASHHLITDAELRRTECFNEFLGPRQFHYGMGAAILAMGNGPAMFVMLREQPKGPYSDDDLAFLRALLPHLSRALQLHGRLAVAEAGRRALADSLDRLSTGVLLLDAPGRVLFTNRAAHQIAMQNALERDRCSAPAGSQGSNDDERERASPRRRAAPLTTVVTPAAGCRGFAAASGEAVRGSSGLCRGRCVRE
jgi:hypothetical protein